MRRVERLCAKAKETEKTPEREKDMFKKNWKPITLFAAALLAEIGIVKWIDDVGNPVLRVAGMVLFFALGALLLFMAGRFFVRMIRAYPAQMTAVGVWIIAFIMMIPLVLALRHMPF